MIGAEHPPLKQIQTLEPTRLKPIAALEILQAFKEEFTG